ncbi:MAG: SpoIIE family protein phosphatase [Chlamydiales bacterium]|nr:SpoIIE family protein phosphatase [Chlamydiales bacterium]
MIKQSFTLRVLVISFLVLALPLLVDSFIYFQNSYYDSIKKAKTDLRLSANFRAFTLIEIKPIKHVFLRELEYFLDIDDLEDIDREKMSKEFAQITHMAGDFEIYLLDLGENATFKILVSSLERPQETSFTSYQVLPHIVRVGEGSFVRYMYSDEEKRYIPYIYIARTMKSKKTGNPIGIIMARAQIEEQLNSVLEAEGNIRFALLTLDGIVFDATDKLLIGNYFDSISPTRQEEIIETRDMGPYTISLDSLSVIKGDDPPFFEFIFNNQIQIAYRAYIADFALSILAYSPKETLFGEALRHFLFIYSVYGLILVVGGGVTYWLSLWISRPLRQLSFLMGEVSQGNLEVRFENEPLGFEINILGGIFNNTLVNLLENIQRAEDERVKKETYQRELAIGRQVQRSLLPSEVPKISGAELAGTYLPALDVGGDFFSYISSRTKKGEDRLVINIADAAGKGISSCLYALSARSLIKTYSTLTDDPGEALSKTNNAFIADAGDTGMFVTMLTAYYHGNSRILSYYSCGHVAPFVRRSDGRLLKLEHSGMAIGLKESNGYQTDSIQLEAGDLVIFYTNGLVEAVNDRYQPFSENRLKSCLQQRKWTTAQEAVDGLTAELQTFTGNASQEEEVIIVALKVDE